MQTETLKVTGMTSEQCIDVVTRALSAVAGVNEVNVSLLRNEVAVQFDETLAATGQLKNALAQAGYTASCAGKAEEAKKSGCCGGCCH